MQAICSRRSTDTSDDFIEGLRHFDKVLVLQADVKLSEILMQLSEIIKRLSEIMKRAEMMTLLKDYLK